MPGGWLHGFEWLPDKDSDIGTIHEEWNWLDNHSPEDMRAKNVHFTLGGPWYKQYENQDYASIVGTLIRGIQ